MAVVSHLGSINFAYPGNIRQVHEDLMSKARNEAIYINNKYKIEIEPVQFEWDMFLPTLEKDVSEMLDEILSHNNNE